jgi:glycosyltransferase involved in cell wall biosynthesis
MSDQTELPLISVAMPVYNAGLFLRPAVLSILSQTYRNWELLIIDDGSTDNCLSSIADIHDSRITLMQDGLNKGLAARLNQAIEMAHGRFLARMDQDDISYPERFERQVDFLQRNCDVDLLAVRVLAISPEGEPIGYLPFCKSHDEIVSKPWNGFYLAHPTWMGRVEWFRKYGYATYHCEDQGLILRSYETSRFASLPEVLFAYRLRRAFNWRKTASVRAIFLSMQLKQYLKKKHLWLAVMAFLAFCAKSGRDFMNYFLMRRIPSFSRSMSSVAFGDVCRWREVQNNLSGLGKGLGK